MLELFSEISLNLIKSAGQRILFRFEFYNTDLSSYYSIIADQYYPLWYLNYLSYLIVSGAELLVSLLTEETVYTVSLLLTLKSG